MTTPKLRYSDGAHAARQAIVEGFPRWMYMSDRPSGQFIDPDTGLPLAGLSGPNELADAIAAFIRGYNETISAGIISGEFTVDFRPLLMSRPEVLRALEEGHIGKLSTENPRIEAPDGAFVLQLRLPKRNANQKLTWVSYRRAGQEWPKFSLYDSPEDVAIGQNGRVLVFKSSCLLLTRDVETSQVLNSYPL